MTPKFSSKNSVTFFTISYILIDLAQKFSEFFFPLGLLSKFERFQWTLLKRSLLFFLFSTISFFSFSLFSTISFHLFSKFFSLFFAFSYSFLGIFFFNFLDFFLHFPFYLYFFFGPLRWFLIFSSSKEFLIILLLLV